MRLEFWVSLTLEALRRMTPYVRYVADKSACYTLDDGVRRLLTGA